MILFFVHHSLPKRLIELIDDPRVTDICLSSMATDIDRGNGLEREASLFESDLEISNFARELIELGGRRLDQANPFADVSLPGGLRVHAALASGCSSQTLLSMRLHSQVPLTLEQLQEKSFVTESQLKLLKKISEDGESFLISGATGSGKTTLLRAMLNSKSERIIAVEDVTELAGSNLISLQTRNPNIENQGEITLERLVREALRMRPDRLVVGEVRGRELFAMLQALNTGHRGAATIHASSFEKVPERLLSIASESDPRSLSLMVKAAFDWVIALETIQGKRTVSKIGRFHLEGSRLAISEHQLEKALS